MTINVSKEFREKLFSFSNRLSRDTWRERKKENRVVRTKRMFLAREKAGTQRGTARRRGNTGKFSGKVETKAR